MSVDTGTASSQSDLLSKLKTFLEGESWVTKRYSAGDELIIMAPGMGGTDEIYTGLKVFKDVGADYYNFRIGGFTGYASGNTFALQPGASTRMPILPVSDTTMTYWFIADGRCCHIVVKVSTNYELATIGFGVDVYASPGQYPYPIFCGGSMNFTTEPALNSASWRWSNNTGRHRQYVCPFPEGSLSSVSDRDSPCQLRMPGGSWRGFWAGSADGYSPGSFGNGDQGSSAGLEAITTVESGVWPSCNKPDNIGTQLDGDVYSVPYVLFTSPNRGDSPEQIGELRGIRKISGTGISAEDTVPIDGEDWLVIPNIFRSNKEDFTIVRLA